MTKIPSDKLIDVVTSEKEIEKANEQWHLSKYDSQNLIKALYDRGVEIKDIFARYYEFEVAGNGRTIDVEDAQLTYGKGE